MRIAVEQVLENALVWMDSREHTSDKTQQYEADDALLHSLKRQLKKED